MLSMLWTQVAKAWVMQLSYHLSAGVVSAPAGTLKLREAMSKQLVKMVTVARPALMAAAQAQLAALRVELAAMPPAAVLGDGHAEMLRLIDDVSMSIQVRLCSMLGTVFHVRIIGLSTCLLAMPTCSPQHACIAHALAAVFATIYTIIALLCCIVLVLAGGGACAQPEQAVLPAPADQLPAAEERAGLKQAVLPAATWRQQQHQRYRQQQLAGSHMCTRR
jgi:hypothetical protein